ncbi:MAG: ComEC/Rec2 family competence protein [Gemmatimonadaceae bacterium]
MPQRPTPSSTRFAGSGNPFVYDEPDGAVIQHLLWGDWLRLKSGKHNEWREVRARGCYGWMRDEDIQRERILEVVFVDVGQGDGCLVVTPEDEHIVIDAGADDSMYRFLNWRYGGFREPWVFDVGIISHPDEDHYLGLSDLFTMPNVTFDVIYHNGILEYRGSDALGKRQKINHRSCLTQLCPDEDALQTFLGNEPNWRHPSRAQYDKQYAAMLSKGLANGSFSKFRSLGRANEFLPGWNPGSRSVELEVLGPVLDEDGTTSGLRWLGNAGFTKNGHSVVLKLRYGDVSMLLGGDLNIPAQEWLLEHHTGLDPRPTTRDDHDTLISAARLVFQVDMAKACHHGSADVSTRFMEATNPVATVISSGDNESHAHPRADALGATGRHGRGNRPLIFSTELGRSSSNSIKRPEIMKARLRELREEIRMAHGGSALAKKLVSEFDKIVDQIDRSVAVFGAIQLRTDGRNVVLAQKLESPRGKTKWEIYTMVNRGGALRYESKFD